MAEEKLLTTLTKHLTAGKTPEEAKKRLIAEGWTAEDVNGALAIHSLAQLPIGQHPGTLWRDIQKKEVEKTGWFQKSVVLLLCMGVGMSIADWYGIQIPYIRQYAITSALQDNFSLEALRPDFMESMSSTVVATSTPSMNKKTDSLEKMDK